MSYVDVYRINSSIPKWKYPLKDKSLTFELDKAGEKIEIHANAEGLRHLIARLEEVLKNNDHEHLLSDEWGEWI
ncbi:MAG: hypothetical protein EOP04_11190 [Proteobacteria bacterium]|nr:MAG: hypothetical protein EOP04_11190 [Pseudomonadota bacterium]